MFNASRSGRNSSCALVNNEDMYDPPLDAREDLFSASDYLRPMAGGAVYGIICGSIFTVPFMLAAGPISFFIALAISAILIGEMAFLMGFSAFIHHQIFLYRLRKYGPQFYSNRISLDIPPAEAFELCLAATTELPKSKITGMDEKNGAIMVSLKGNFWITVDRQVTLRVSPEGTEKSVVSIDPSVKLTRIRRRLIRLIWGEKWYPLIFRSDLNWNRKIMASVTDYIESVPNWDHRHDPHELIESAFRPKTSDDGSEQQVPHQNHDEEKANDQAAHCDEESGHHCETEMHRHSDAA